MTNSINEQLSEKYRKYLVKITVKNQGFYLITGADLEDGEIDKVLVNEKGKLVLFKSINSMFKNIERVNKVFDVAKTSMWAHEIKKPLRPYLEVNSNILEIEMPTSMIEVDYGNLVSLIGIISDYAFQINNSYLIKKITSKAVISFKNEFMDTFIWKNENHIRRKSQFKQAVKFIREAFNDVVINKSIIL